MRETFLRQLVRPKFTTNSAAHLADRLSRKRLSFSAVTKELEMPSPKSLAFQVETPELRNYIIATKPNSIAAQLFKQFPAVTPRAGINGQQYASQTNITLNGITMAATGNATVNLRDFIGFNQYLARVDHSFNADKDQLSFRWIGETQSDQGGTSSSAATNGKAMRGERGFYSGTFGNFNFGYIKTLQTFVNDFRFSVGTVDSGRGDDKAVVPEITITGITAAFGDIFNSKN